MTTSNLDDTAFLSTLDDVVARLDRMLDELSRLIYTMASHGQRTDKPLVLYRALVESANQAKTLRSQEIELVYTGANDASTPARTGSPGPA
jgi:hypothetical protein